MEVTQLHMYILLSLVLITGLLILIVLLYMLQIIRLLLLPTASSPQSEAVPAESWWAPFRRKFVTGHLQPIAQEQSILLEHNYDGIQELDHRMPPWLAYFFSTTIVFAVIYMVNFWVLGTVPGSKQEYQAEVALAEQQIAAYKRTAAAGIDENNAQQTTDAAALEAGKALFAQNCQACHGSAGEGGVGPNLTDEYWLHGGSINAVFKTIKYGVPEKGMIAWQQKLKPEEIQNLSSYILTLQGSNPANSKEPQGEKIVLQLSTHGNLSLK